MLTLFWTLPKGSGQQQRSVAGFLVFRSKRMLTEGECKECPLRFTQVARLSVVKKNGPQKMRYQESLDQGYLYAYKVVAYTRKGVLGADSNIVKIRR